MPPLRWAFSQRRSPINMSARSTQSVVQVIRMLILNAGVFVIPQKLPLQAPLTMAIPDPGSYVRNVCKQNRNNKHTTDLRASTGEPRSRSDWYDGLIKPPYRCAECVLVVRYENDSRVSTHMRRTIRAEEKANVRCENIYVARNLAYRRGDGPWSHQDKDGIDLSNNSVSLSDSDREWSTRIGTWQLIRCAESSPKKIEITTNKGHHRAPR